MTKSKNTYSELLKKNKEILSSLDSEVYNVAVLSNSTVNNVKEILEYNLRLEGINAHLDIGNYDNIVQDSYDFKNSNAVVIFWDLFNVTDNIYYKAESIESTKLDELISQVERGIDIVFENLKNTRSHIFKFSNKSSSDNASATEESCPLPPSITTKSGQSFSSPEFKRPLFSF